MSVIPNAIDTDVFSPDPSRRDPDFREQLLHHRNNHTCVHEHCFVSLSCIIGNAVTFVVMSRLAYRKGGGSVD